MNIGEFLKLVRKRRRVTLMQMAEGTGISYTMLARIETHQLLSPSPCTLRDIAVYLNVPYTQVMAIAGYLSAADLSGPHLNDIPLIEDSEFLKVRPRGIATLSHEAQQFISVPSGSDFAVRLGGVYMAPFPAGYIAMVSTMSVQANDDVVVQSATGQLAWAKMTWVGDELLVPVFQGGWDPEVEILGRVIGLVAEREVRFA